MSNTISSPETITGSLIAVGSLTGELVIPDYISDESYDGDYVVSPDFAGKTLPTAGKKLTQNIVIEKIAVETVSNLSGGNTVYIGGIN